VHDETSVAGGESVEIGELEYVCSPMIVVLAVGMRGPSTLAAELIDVGELLLTGLMLVLEIEVVFIELAVEVAGAVASLLTGLTRALTVEVVLVELVVALAGAVTLPRHPTRQTQTRRAKLGSAVAL
jgi:hypothetical protein